MRVLVDTNVILDIALKRKPFFEESAGLLKLTGSADLEDAVQCAAAENENVSTVVTRNEADFSRSKLTVLSPAALIDKIG